MPGGGGTPGGSNAGLFLPPGQGQVAGQLQPLVQPMANQGINALNTLGGNTPAGYAWPYVQGTASNILNNPYQGQAVQGGLDAASIFQNQISPAAFGAAPQLFNLASLGAGQARNAFDAANNPAYGQAQSYGTQGAAGINPLISQLLSAAQSPLYGQAQGAGGTLGSQLTGAAGSALNSAFNTPLFTTAQEAGFGSAEQLQGAAAQTYANAFDPQQALYQRTQQQIQDQVNAQLAASGVGSTPYGQGVLGDTLKNFNIDWQNQQLGRQIAGGQAVNALDQGVLSQLTEPSLAQLQAQAQGANTAAGLAGAGLSSFLTPANASLAAAQQGLTGYEGGTASQLSDLLTPANAQVVANLQGSNAFGNIANSVQGLESGGLGVLNNLASAAPGFAAAPYNALNQVQGNNFGALQNQIALGNQVYSVPQQTIGNLEQYLGLGQNASQLANSIGATNFNQAAALGGGTINALGGINNLTGGGITNLFGGGTGGAAGIGADFGGGGAALGVPDALGLAGGGGDALAAAAPLAFS